MRYPLNQSEYPVGKELIQGKTKRINAVAGKSGLVVASYKKEITAFDDERLTKVFGTKDVDSNAVTCRIFELLIDAGLPVAYLGQLTDTSFVAPKVTMAPIEPITRRRVHPEGSIRKRRPELPVRYRFPELTFEVCLKTHRGGKFTDIHGQEVDLALPPEDDKPTDDPMALDPFADDWQLIGKSPITAPKILATVKRDDIVRSNEDIVEYRRLLHASFLIIEAYFNMINWTTYDLKVECGLLGEDFTMPNGKLLKAGTIVIADVIDHDSWRVLDQFGREMSKQAFRHMILEGGEIDIEELVRIYATVVKAVEGFQIIPQALILWRGSSDDSFPSVNLQGAMGELDLGHVPGLTVEYATGSGHKKIKRTLDRLNELEAKYKNAAIVVEVGRSNGLGPTLAAHTIFPVISRPASLEKFHEDVWGSLRLPSDDPMATVLDQNNAILLALRHLAPMNPVIAAWLRFQMEQYEAMPLD